MRGIQNVIEILIGIMLLICGIKDLRYKKIPLWVVTVTFLIIVVLGMFCSFIPYTSRIGGVCIGIIIIFISKITREQIGLGDGLVFCVTGIGLGIWINIGLLLWSLCFSAIYAGFVLIVKKKNKKHVIPWIPFVFFSYLWGLYI